MATKTFEELKQLAIQIRDEKTNKQNTATRIGTQMLEHLEKLEQDYYDKTTINNRTSEYNVSINHPTSGISGGNKYDLASAIGQVPAELRTDGLTISFINSDGDTEKWEFSGGSWTVGGFSQVGAGKLTELELNHIICYIMLNGSNVSYIGINGSNIWDDSSNPYLSRDTGEYQYYAGASGYAFVSPYVYIGCLNTFLLTIYKRSSYACVVFYDKDKNILSVINGEENVQVTRLVIQVPDNAVFVRLCGSYKYPFSVYLPENVNKNVYLSEQAKFYAKNAGEDVYYDASINYSSTDNPISKINDSPGMTAIFHEIAFIGDSLSHGLFWDKYGWEGTNIDILGQYSWGQRLVNMFNANGANYAISGYTAKDWIEHFWDEEAAAEYTSDGLEQKIKLNKKQAYCIMLGANDRVTYEAGNIETDIDLEDFNNNDHTFAGYYAGIIQRIKTIQPSAKFFVITTPKIWFPSLEEEYVEFNNPLAELN